MLVEQHTLLSSVWGRRCLLSVLPLIHFHLHKKTYFITYLTSINSVQCRMMESIYRIFSAASCYTSAKWIKLKFTLLDRYLCIIIIIMTFKFNLLHASSLKDLRLLQPCTVADSDCKYSFDVIIVGEGIYFWMEAVSECLTHNNYCVYTVNGII